MIIDDIVYDDDDDDDDKKNKEDQMTEYRQCLWFSRLHFFLHCAFFPVRENARVVYKACNLANFTPHNFYHTFCPFSWFLSLNIVSQKLSNMTLSNCDQDFDRTEIIIARIEGWSDVKEVWFCCGENVPRRRYWQGMMMMMTMVMMPIGVTIIIIIIIHHAHHTDESGGECN